MPLFYFQAGLKDGELLQYFDDLSELSGEDELNIKNEDRYRTESSETESEVKFYSVRSLFYHELGNGCFIIEQFSRKISIS